MMPIELRSRPAPRRGGNRGASGQPARNSRLWEPGAQSLCLDLEERLDVRKAGQAMSAEALEADARRGRSSDGGPGLPGDDYLPAVSRRADARRRVDGQSDVTDIGQRRAAAVDPHAN